MTFRRPPALADWLMDRLGGARRDSALAGDLLEAFRDGRSAAWYWRQTLVVLAHGIAGQCRELRTFLLALSAAYAVQFAVVVALWATTFPPALHISGWAKGGVWLLYQFLYGVFEITVSLVVTGKSGPNLKRMWCGADGSHARSKVLRFAAWQSFSKGLANFCLCALIFPRFSLQGLVEVELVWFVLWVGLPPLIDRPPAARVETTDVEPSWGDLQSEPVVTVTLKSGRTIALDRHNLAQSVFAVADAELIGLVFGQHRSLELLRRAIWLAGCPMTFQEQHKSLSPAELKVLIDEAARTESVTETWYRATRPESFRERFRHWFCGDSA